MSPPTIVSTALNILISQRKKIIKIKFSQRLLKILIFLEKAGVVNNYIVGRQFSAVYPPYVWISLFFYKSKPFFQSLKLVSKPSKKYFISFKALKILQKFIGLSVLVLETSAGIISHSEAIAQRRGGVFLLILS